MPQPYVPYPKAIQLFPEIRQSLLAEFDRCALTTWFSFRYRKGWSFPWQARGEMFHRFASRALAQMAMTSDDGTIPVAEALEILHEVLRQDDIDRFCPRCGSPRIRKGVTRHGLRMCLACRKHFETNFILVPEDMVTELYWVVKKWAHDNAFSVENLVDVEKRLETKLYYPNPNGGWVERTLNGTADALLIEGVEDDHAIVLDWKDMWRLPPPTEVGHGGYFQQRFYALLIFRNYPTVSRVTLREFYVRYSEPREATLWRETDLEQIERELSAKIEQFDRTVEEKLWVPSPGHHCGYCAAPQKCTIFPEARGAGRIGDAEQAEQVAAELVVAEAIVKQQREQLEAWCQMHGTVPIRDAKGARVIGLESYERTERPTHEQIAQAEREYGRALHAYEIQEMYRTRRGTRLKQFVPRPELETEQDEAMIEKLKESVRRATAA
jgi:hypothetical protein